MAFSRIKAVAVNEPVTFVKIAATANVTSVPRSSTSYNCNYKLDQSSEVAYFDAPEDTTFTTSDYVVLSTQGNNSFMTGANFDASYTAFESDLGSLVNLTDNSGGTAANTIAAIGGTYSQSEVRNAIASLAAKINEIIDAE